MAEHIKKVLIVGAGISGLTAALAFRRRGVDDVEILEKASELAEVGAAISCAPNSTRILLSYGFSPARARSVSVGPQYEFDSAGNVVDYFDLAALGERAGWPWWWTHRADLHRELVRLATETARPTPDAAWGTPAAVRLGVRVVATNTEQGWVQDQDGRRWRGDLVLGADGVRSVVRGAVTGGPRGADGLDSVYSGHSAYRCLLDIPALRRDPELAGFVDRPKMQNWVGRDGRRVLMYPCRDNTLLNVFAPVPMPAASSVESWRATGETRDLVAAFQHFPARLQKLLSTCPGQPALWQIRDRDPVRGWSRGRVVLLGDAAHAMLPHQGQGGAQSIEDAAALPIFIFEAPPTWSLPQRLRAFEEFRFPRVRTVVERSRQQKLPPRDGAGIDGRPSIRMRDMGAMQVDYDVESDARAWLREKGPLGRL